jgi:hypothetical protein
MIFTKRLRGAVRSGRIRCSVRIWTRPHVKVGGRYRMDEGHIVVDSIASIEIADITTDLAQESGFSSVEDLLGIAKHGGGDNVYLIRFHYLRPGAWDEQPDTSTDDAARNDEPKRSQRQPASRKTPSLLQRIRGSSPSLPRRVKGGPPTRPRPRRRD